MTKGKNEITSLGTTLAFLKCGACSTTLFNVVNRAYDHPLKSEEEASIPFAGGIMQHGYQCGMIWGSALAAGAQAHQLYGTGPEAETKAIIASQRVVESFRARENAINCLEITDLDNTSTTMQQLTFFLLKGGTIGCFRMAARYAPVAFEEINNALAQENAPAPCSPVSCAAKLARKMGASEEHAVMAAGFAGGIGLCGGACGALGAAIWVMAMNTTSEQGGKVDYKDPRALEVIDRFMKCTDYKIECSEIVGRKFENVEDHAAFINDGGCSKIIEVLADENR